MGYKIINVYKPLGCTPLEAIRKLKEQRPELAREKITYLGRLDPMAEGVLLVLAGKHGKEDREKYLKLDKCYEAEVLFGFGSDTGDALGIVQKKAVLSSLGPAEIKSVLGRFEGSVSMALPAYSAAVVLGKPLHVWARKGKLGEIELPVRRTEIFKIALKKFFFVGGNELLGFLRKSISRVDGDFRQEAAMASWKKLLSGSASKSFPAAGIEISCSSGTYIRSLAAELGSALGTAGLLIRLRRTRVGRYKIGDSLKI